MFLLEDMKKKDCVMKLYWVVTIWAKWQIVIPKEIREKLNIWHWDTMAVLLKDDKYVWLVKNEDINGIMEYVSNINDKKEIC